MSALLATVTPRGIKASHRRRRSIASGHIVQRFAQSIQHPATSEASAGAAQSASITTYNAPGSAAPVVNAYHYNQRRLLDGQGDSVSQPGWYAWGIGYGYNANGQTS